MPDSVGDEDPILAPDELELDGDRIQRIDENRYLIESDVDGTGEPEGAGDDAESNLQGASERFVIDAVVKTDHGIDRTLVRSDDIRDVFGEYLRWYAGRIDPSAPPAEVLSVLLEATDLKSGHR